MTIALTDLLPLAPVLITSATAIAVMLTVAFRRNHFWNATLTVVGLNLALLVLLWGLWQGHLANVTELLVVDAYAAFFMVLILIATLGCATLAHVYLNGYHGNREEFYMLLLIAATGGMVLVASNHLAALFIGLELLSVPLYGMVAYTRNQRHSLEAGIKYLVLSAAGSAFILFGMALIYAKSGALSFQGISAYLSPEAILEPLMLIGTGLMVVGLGFKLSFVPFHLWTPDVYEGAPAPVGAFLATVSKIAVFAVFFRFLSVTPASGSEAFYMLLQVIAVLSILFGNLLALNQANLKRMLGYSSIAHFGYLLVAVLAGHAISLEAVLVYLLTYVLATMTAFGVVALMSRAEKERDADMLADYRGLFWQRPYLAAVLTIALLSLAGIPLTAGFIGKFYVFTAGANAQLWGLLGVVVVGSALSVFYYLKAMAALYMAKPGMRRYEPKFDWGQRAGGIMVSILFALTVVVGIYPEPLLDLIQIFILSSAV
ncbi:MAG: NADH-quinone oxidoreductase subunit NuoN [Pseudomonadales bacterium]|jgi:NADH-quinone oxidoreductase subunit N|nr:NADH-quinone oxidoreductase subunit NuoN [Pseudomonadales bacterium]MCC6529252.1 NADH-quinone oxidoreductase subunit NuoN [Pseudomonadales bacterium]MCP5332570.1 NADH-quinone oxidoreductase subunit NuoN [Pseudomonadales bacterium]HMU89131.1 NADH-quinone oxidoreductase subunit NuoN [Pseudomonadales bacterium]HMW14026.1 NADH-quinone oxidoreductase subunit NuoN [Pseudomonadales bacterium]